MVNYVVEYVNPDHFEEKWHREYVYGAFFVFPPDEIMTEVDLLRNMYDPKSAGYCSAHISLSEPLRRPLTIEGVDEIQKTIGKIQGFEMTYGPLRTFPPHPGVCFAISPEDRFFELRERLHECSVFAGDDIARKNIAPHMTIAEFGLDMEKSEELKTRLHGEISYGSFDCDAIEYAVPNRQFYFERKFKLSLG